MMIGIGMPISHNRTPRMVRDSVYGGGIPLQRAKQLGVPGCLSGDGGAGRGFELERGRQ